MIRLENVTKFFRTSGEKKYILKNVSFTIPEGVNLGILGRNGAGKSTFLRMLGGIDFPNSGEITSDRSFSWPMGLSGGFQQLMTGRQNVKFVCRIYGKDDEEITRIISSVKQFSELGEYFDMPIKMYSNGMRARLSFGLSLAFDFDYLIIDETLSVGDQNFKKKAKDALLKKIEACNILLVSHSMEDLKKLCDSGVVLDNGQLHYFDKIDDAIAFYHELNLQSAPAAGGGIQSSAIYCSDGKIFDNIQKAATFYKVKPLSIIQALDHNNGSHIYLKKVFWKDGQSEKPFQQWQNTLPQKNIISTDGMIFEDSGDAADFYHERHPNLGVSSEEIERVTQSGELFRKNMKLRFYYLDNYQRGKIH